MEHLFRLHSPISIFMKQLLEPEGPPGLFGFGSQVTHDRTTREIKMIELDHNHKVLTGDGIDDRAGL